MNLFTNQNSNLNNVKSLLAHNDTAFINMCYKTLLSREPDSSGMSNYLGQLESGVSKIDIIIQIRCSKEGVLACTNLPGLERAIKRYKLSRRKIIGPFFRMLFNQESSHPNHVRVRAIANSVERMKTELSSLNKLQVMVNQLEAVTIGQNRLSDLVSIMVENSEIKPHISDIYNLALADRHNAKAMLGASTISIPQLDYEFDPSAQVAFSNICKVLMK